MTRILWRIVCTPGHRFVADVLVVPHDLWLGCSWHSDISTARRRCLRVSLCVVPLVLLRVSMVLWHVSQAWPGDAGADDNGKESIHAWRRRPGDE